VRIPVPAISVLSPVEGRRYPTGQPVQVIVRVDGSFKEATLSAYVEGEDNITPLALEKEPNGHSWTGEVENLNQGIYTLTITFEGEMPEGVLLEREVSISFEVARRGKPWALFLLPGGFLILLAGGWLWHKGRQSPFPEGVLKVVRGPEGETGKQWDLSSFGKKKVFLGSGAKCEIRFACPGEVPFRAGYFSAKKEATGVKTIFVPLSGGFTVNGIPNPGERALSDGDLIAIGPYSLRYENLRQKAAGRMWRRNSPFVI